MIFLYELQEKVASRHGRGIRLIDHIGIAISNYGLSKAFYSKALAPLGIELNIIELNIEVQGWAGFGAEGKAELWFDQATDDEHKQNTSPLPMHLAFRANSTEVVDQFYQATIEAGATSNGEPGMREIYHPNYYGAFVIDPNGHNLEAVCHEAGAG
jgi:catechol 2,3-dioxygenase-like lactoylglutathione lyase family enzyme